MNQNTFWLKLSALKFFFLVMASPLRPFDREALSRSAEKWRRAHPKAAPKSISRRERLTSKSARSAFSALLLKQQDPAWELLLACGVAAGRTVGARLADWVTWARSARSATVTVSSASPVRRQGKIGWRHVQQGRIAMAHRQSRSKGLQTEKGSGMSSTHRSRWPWKDSTSSRVTSTSSSATGSRTTTSVPVVVAPKMDAELVELADTRPELLMRFLISVRVESLADVRGLWGSSSDFLQELEDFSGAKMFADLTMQMATFWTTANAKALSYHKRLVRALVQDRQSSDRAPPTMHAEAPVLASSIPSRVKRLVATGLPGPPATTVALADVLSLEQLGVTWETLEDAVILQGTKDVVLANASRLGLGRLSALIAAYRRWKRYAIEAGVEVNKPLPIQVALFLKKVSQGGPTAASSQYQAMLWWQRCMGAELPMEHWLVTPWRLHNASHQGAQATELPPWEFLNLLRWTATLQGTHQLLASFMIMVAVACVRYEHVQRSQFIRKHDGWLEFFCRQGKSRKQGTRPGFAWSVPDIQWKGYSLCAVLADYFRNEALSELFLIPALELQSEDLWEVTRSTPLILNKPMSRGRFLELLRGSLMQINVDPQSAARAQYNRLRRFLPTAGNVVQLQPMEMQAVGNWTDIPAWGGGEPGATKPRAVMHMGLHYAGDKVSRSFIVKAHVLKVFMSLFRRRQGEFALDEQGLLIRGSWEWPEVSAMFELYKAEFDEVQPPDPLPAPSSSLEEDKDLVVLDVVPAPGPELPVEHPELAQDRDAEDSEDRCSVADSDSSQSASDISAEGHDLLDRITDAMDFSESQWLQQGAKLHLVRRRLPKATGYLGAEMPPLPSHHERVVLGLILWCMIAPASVVWHECLVALWLRWRSTPDGNIKGKSA